MLGSEFLIKARELADGYHHLGRQAGPSIVRGSELVVKAASGPQAIITERLVEDVAFEGHKTDVLALVTSSLHEEILLSWRTLQPLGIIPEDFPHVVIKAKSVSMAHKESLKCLMVEQSSVFDVGEELRTMKGEPIHIHLKDEPIRLLHICNP